MANKTFSSSVTVTAVASVEIGTILTRGATGRTTRSTTPDEKAAETLANDWFQNRTHESFSSHHALDILRNALVDAPISLGRIDAFRGIVFPEAEALAKIPSDCGPPPQLHTTQGRYNHEESPVLYLATTIAGVQAELPKTLAGERIVCQKYSIDFGELKILDLTSPELPDILNYAFDNSELNKNRSDYVQSQVLSDAVRNAGYSGMLIPGVRGSATNRYANVVIFNPSNEWPKWLAPGTKPQVL